MHGARTLLDLGEEAVRRLARRGYTLDLATLEDLFSRRNSVIKSGDDLRAESKQVAAEVGRTAKAGGDVEGLKERARDLKEQVRASENEQEKAQARAPYWTTHGGGIEDHDLSVGAALQASRRRSDHPSTRVLRVICRCPGSARTRA